MLRHPQAYYNTRFQIFARQDARNKAKSLKKTGWPKARAIQTIAPLANEPTSYKYVWVVSPLPAFFLLADGTIGK